MGAQAVLEMWVGGGGEKNLCLLVGSGVWIFAGITH